MNPARAALMGSPIVWFVFLMFLRLTNGQGIAPSSETTAPGPSSNGETIDQGIAYILMLLALALTYIFH